MLYVQQLRTRPEACLMLVWIGTGTRRMVGMLRPRSSFSQAGGHVDRALPPIRQRDLFTFSAGSKLRRLVTWE